MRVGHQIQRLTCAPYIEVALIRELKAGESHEFRRLVEVARWTRVVTQTRLG